MTWITDLQDWLTGIFGDTESLRTLFPIILAVLAFLLGLAIALLIGGLLDPLKQRVGAVKNEQAARVDSAGSVAGILNRIGGILSPKKGKKRTNITRQLELAGYRSANAFRFFFAFRLIGVIGVPLILLTWAGLSSALAVGDAMLYSVAGAAIAYVVPDMWLSRRVRGRQRRLRHALPDALDLMVVCTEAGLGLNAAIQRVADEIEIQHPEMSDELKLVMMQIRAGMDNRSALKDLQERTGLEEIRSFVTTLMQSLRFGTSIADSLRVFSEDMRDKRLQRAQEQAAKLSVKMLGPIAVFILPAFLLVAMGPAIFSMMRALSQGGIGG